MLCVAIGATVVAAMAIVIVLIRTRRPPRGVRTWVKDAQDAWKNDELTPPAGTRSIDIDELLTGAPQTAVQGTDVSGIDQLAAPQPRTLPSYEPRSARVRPSQSEGEAATARAEDSPGEQGVSGN